MISIITITYNNYEELLKTINSIPNSEGIEKIVINGGDCTNTENYLKKSSIKYISESDAGIADAFNKGVKIASGDYIMFLNSGDILLDKNYPLNAVSVLKEKEDIDFVHSNLLLADLTGIEIIMKPTFSNLGRGMPFLHPTMIVKKVLFNKIGMFDTKYKIAMDFDWISKLIKNNSKGYYINGEPVVLMDGGGKSVAQEKLAIKECFSILKKNDLLTFENYVGYIIRYSLFFIRNFLLKIGLVKLLKKLKKMKYSL
jgi:glycosyltransferase involved in cell wall biosynthesis